MRLRRQPLRDTLDNLSMSSHFSVHRLPQSHYKTGQLGQFRTPEARRLFCISDPAFQLVPLGRSGEGPFTTAFYRFTVFVGPTQLSLHQAVSAVIKLCCAGESHARVRKLERGESTGNLRTCSLLRRLPHCSRGRSEKLRTCVRIASSAHASRLEPRGLIALQR